MANEDNIGFAVSMDSDARNAIVTKIENKENKSRGLQIGSRIVEINGTNIQGWKHKNIIEKIEKEKTRPLCIVFKQVKCYYFCYIYYWYHNYYYYYILHKNV